MKKIILIISLILSFTTLSFAKGKNEIKYLEDNSIVIKWYDNNGVVESESYYKLDGISKYYYKSGALKFETPYKNGVADGIAKDYYENGALMTNIPYKNNNQEGIAKRYDKNGKIWAELTLKENKAISGKCANGRKWTNEELKSWLFNFYEDERLSNICNN